MITIIKLKLHNSGKYDCIRKCSCDYPGCVNVRHFDTERELIRLGWIITEPDHTDGTLCFCPFHTAYVNRLNDKDRKKVFHAIARERKKYIDAITQSL